MAKTKHKQRIGTISGSQALKNIQKGTAAANMTTGYRSFTHARILSAIADDPHAKEAFKSLPSVKHVVFGTGDGLPMVLVGHSLLGGQKGGQVWAKLSKDTDEDAEHLSDSGYWRGFYAWDGTRLSQQCHTNFELDQPFSDLALATADQFWAVVVFYLIEKGHFSHMSIQTGFLHNFKAACAQIANDSEPSSVSVPVSDPCTMVKKNFDVNEAETPNGSNGKIPGEDDQLDDMARIKREIEAEFGIRTKKSLHTPSQIQVDKDELAECQIFVRRIKDRARHKYNAVVASLWEKVDEVQAKIDTERVRYDDLHKKYSALHLANQVQRKKNRVLEKELREHREWRETMRKLF